MEVRRHASGAELLREAGALLYAREAEHSLVIGFAKLGRGFEGCELGITAWSGGAAVAAMLQTSINEAMVSAGGEAAAAALGGALAAAGTRSRGVVGPTAESSAAAAAFAARAGASLRVERRLLLHRLGREPEAPGPGAGLRAAVAADAPLLTAWAEGFDLDTRSPAHVRDAARKVRRGIAAGRLFVLEEGGRAVAAASWGRPTEGTKTITCVYTPPEERGRGRGRAVTAAITRELFGMGTREVLIFTDADDPTPNRVYARVGFRVLAEFMHWAFVWDGPPLHPGRSCPSPERRDRPS